MYLSELELEGFRNYGSLKLEFPEDKPCVLLIGDNAQGKTNLIESIYMLSVAKPFRTNRIGDVIQWEADFARIKGRFFKDGGGGKMEDFSLEVFLSKPKKATKKNDVMISGNDFMGLANVVLFHPQDMNLLLLSPDLRRKYVNLLGSQTDRGYLQALIHYNRVLKNRNHLLSQIQRGRARDDECFFWDGELVKSGSELIVARMEICKFMNELVTEIYDQISDGDDKVRIKYESFVKEGMDLQEVAMLFSSKLLEKKDSDLRYGYTSVGPHRDDLTFYLNGKKVENHGSRGECRTLLIALKLAEIRYIEEMVGDTPILLLDDVFSELDLSRQQKLLEALNKCQTFITGTSDDQLSKLKGIHRFGVEKGDVK